MKVKLGDALVYRDSQGSNRYGTGVVVSIIRDEYEILWSRRGLARYKRSIIDDRLEQIFGRVDEQSGLPKEAHLSIGASKRRLAFNENYDRVRMGVLCENLKVSGARNASNVAEGITRELLKKKLVPRGRTKTVLKGLAELCSASCDEAQDISRELFFGYVLRTSDFGQP
jgi:hypothetical protein